MDDHMSIWKAESAALEPTDWDRWIEAVEKTIGTDVDGDVRADGFSIDTFHDMFEAGLDVETAATRIVGAAFVAPNGDVYRLREAQCNLGDRYTEHYAVLLVSGSSTYSYALPENSTLVWSPLPSRDA